MKRPTFYEGVVVALAASLGASVLYRALIAILPGVWVLQGVTAALAGGYLLYLLARSPARVGRISALALWALATVITLFLEPSLAVHLLVQITLVWLIRSLFFYSGVLPALADLGLSGFALCVSIWAAERSGSIFLSVWCLLLVQALFVAIPSNLQRHGPRSRPRAWQPEDPFERAHRAAEGALRRL